MVKIVFGSLRDEGLEVVLREGRHYVRYDAGAHVIVWREDEITDSELQAIMQGGEQAHKAMLQMQRRLEQSGVNPYVQNWAPQNVQLCSRAGQPQAALVVPYAASQLRLPLTSTLGTVYKPMFKALQIRIAKLGWLAALIGTLMVMFAAASVWLLFALKDFSSAVRDTYETPPGVVHYIFFGMVCLSLLLIFVAGVVMLVLGLIRRSRDV